MLSLQRATFCCILLLFIYGCKKNEGVVDDYISPPDQITALKTLVTSAGREFIEIEWNKVEHSHFEEVTYAVYLDGEQIVDQLTGTKYSLINLQPGKNYSIKVIASTKNGKQAEQSLEGSTLPALTAAETIYIQQYSIHDFSILRGPTTLVKLEDGGHLLLMALTHASDFTHLNNKMIVFRVDRYGRMLWYRLLDYADFNLLVDSAAFQLMTIKSDQEGILFAGNHAMKFAVENGDLLLMKSYNDLLPDQNILSVTKVSSLEILAATNYANLVAINPNNLQVIWHKGDQGQSGTLESIQVDSKKNVYGIFTDRNEMHTPIKVNKYDANGKFSKSFQFDGTLEGEHNWGFYMTALLVDQQDDLYLFGYNASFSYTRYFKFKSDGTLIKKNQQSESFHITGASFNAKGDIIAKGQLEGSGRNTWGGIYVFDKDMNIKTRRIWTDLPPHSLSGITSNTDGTYNLFSSFLAGDSKYVGFTYIKTALDGKI